MCIVCGLSFVNIPWTLKRVQGLGKNFRNGVMVYRFICISRDVCIRVCKVLATVIITVILHNCVFICSVWISPLVLSLSLTGSGDIVGSNLKLILGLVWTLILHYQISLGFGLDEAEKGKDAPTPKQALTNYLKVLYTFKI